MSYSTKDLNEKYKYGEDKRIGALQGAASKAGEWETYDKLTYELKTSAPSPAQAQAREFVANCSGLTEAYDMALSWNDLHETGDAYERIIEAARFITFIHDLDIGLDVKALWPTHYKAIANYHHANGQYGLLTPEVKLVVNNMLLNNAFDQGRRRGLVEQAAETARLQAYDDRVAAVAAKEAARQADILTILNP